jgi:hypothetical protein
MRKAFNLEFHGTQFTVPKLSLFNLFEHQRDLFDATCYKVQSSVPLGIFEIFVKALETDGKVPLTKENAGDQFPFWPKSFGLMNSSPSVPPF